jgi:hypothetical protein
MTAPRVLALLVALTAPLALARGGGAAEPARPSPVTDPAGFSAERAKPIVNVSCVVKMRFAFGGQSGERESKVGCLGTVLDPSGLVLVPNTSVGGEGPEIASFKAMFEGLSLSIVPSEVKVVVGGDGPERPAAIVARDADLGIAFLQILGEEGKPFASLDLAASAEPRLGERLFSVGRKTEGFDRVPLLLRLYASRRIERPRRLWGVAGDYEAAGIASADSPGGFGVTSEFAGGTAAFDSAGRVVGVLARLYAPGDTPQDLQAVDALLPVDAVSKAMEAAKKLVPAAVAKATAPAPASDTK